MLDQYPSIRLSRKLLCIYFHTLSSISQRFKYNKRLKVCSITFCSQPSCDTTFFVSYCFHTNCFISQQHPLLYLKPYPPKQFFLSAGWCEHFICNLLTLNRYKTIFAIKRSGYLSALSSSRAVSTYVDTIISTNYIRLWESVIELLLQTFDMTSKHCVYQKVWWHLKFIVQNKFMSICLSLEAELC